MTKFWKLAPWLTRLMLLAPTIIFTLIASRYLFNPIHAGAADGLAFNIPMMARNRGLDRAFIGNSVVGISVYVQTREPIARSLD
jgi:hypothetical protein